MPLGLPTGKQQLKAIFDTMIVRASEGIEFDGSEEFADAIEAMIKEAIVSITMSPTVTVNPGQAVQVAFPAGTGSTVSPGTATLANTNNVSGNLS